MFENDYLHRQIEIMARALAVAIFHKDITSVVAVDENMIVSEDGLFILMLTKYIKEGNLNEAENYLFEALEKKPSPEIAGIGLQFYEKIESFDDKDLLKFHFSREEIEQGIAEMQKFLV